MPSKVASSLSNSSPSWFCHQGGTCARIQARARSRYSSSATEKRKSMGPPNWRALYPVGLLERERAQVGRSAQALRFALDVLGALAHVVGGPVGVQPVGRGQHRSESGRLLGV